MYEISDQPFIIVTFCGLAKMHFNLIKLCKMQIYITQYKSLTESHENNMQR